MRLLRLLLIASVVLYVCEPHSGINDFEYFFLLFFLSFVECRFWKYQEWSYRRRILFLLLLLLFAIHIFHFFEIHPYMHSGMYMCRIYTVLYYDIYILCVFFAAFRLFVGYVQTRCDFCVHWHHRWKQGNPNSRLRDAFQLHSFEPLSVSQFPGHFLAAFPLNIAAETL